MSHEQAPRSSTLRQPTLAGHRRVDALWWPADWFNEATRRRRIVDSWQAGAKLYRFAYGDLVCLAQPRELDCDTLAAWPLQRIAGTLCSASVQPTEFAGRPVADAWLAVGAQLQALQFADGDTVDPAEWFEFSVPLVVPMDLRVPEPERELVIPPPRALHEVLGPDVPDAISPGTQKLMDALRSASAREKAQGARSLPDASSRGGDRPGALHSMAVAIAVMVFLGVALASSGGSSSSGLGVFLLMLAVGWMLQRMTRRTRQEAASRPSPAQGAAAEAGGANGLRARLKASRVLPQRWRNWLARAAATSGVGRLLGKQHAAYMRRVLEMFDDGRLDEALRHAIPLGVDGESLGQAFGRLGPRNDLSLRGNSGPSTSISFGNDFEAHLRQLYRRAFEQLDRSGRVDEAVYVLAELLRAHQEALDYLERKGLFQKAAELALAWDMPAAQIVRLHVLAKDWRKALLIARRDECFAEAIGLLEARWSAQAAQLRAEWASWLAARGRCVEAIQAIWPLADERHRATPWLDIADAAGGTIAARSLAWRAQGWPDTLASRGDFIDALRHDSAAAEERRALIHELLGLRAPIDPAARRLAALIAGAAIADQASPRPTLERSALIELAGFAADPCLLADLPSLTSVSIGAKHALLRSVGEAIELAVPPPGLVPIVDALPLADGEFLVALGEAGVVRVDARGRRLARFAVPAQRLVLADDNASALGLIRREGAWRVSRLDLARSQAVDLGLHAFHAFSGRFDSSGWAVAVGNRVQMLDILAPSLREAVWQVTDLPGRVVAIDHGESHLERWVMEGAGEGRFHEWAYLLPVRRLQSRDEIPPPTLVAGKTAKRLLVHGRGLVELYPDEKDTQKLLMKGLLGTWSIPLLQADIVHAAEEWLVWRANSGEHLELQLMRWLNGVVQARWKWPTGVGPQVRFHRGICLVFDESGRLCALDTNTCQQREFSLR